jgi:hypothetical protein
MLVAALVLLYGIATLGQQESVPDHFWSSGRTGAVVLVLLGVLAGIGSFTITGSVRSLLRRADADGRLVTPCREIAWLIQDQTAIPAGAVGVHVWEIAGPFFARRLRRRATFRTKSARQMPVLWTRGKGVLGQCWASSAENQLNDMKELDAHATSESAFCAIPAVDRFNMTWQEYAAGRHYGVIWVAKLFAGLGDAPKLRGMLSIDIEGHDYADELRVVLNDRGKDVLGLLAMCEEIL